MNTEPRESITEKYIIGPIALVGEYICGISVIFKEQRARKIFVVYQTFDIS